MTAHFQSDPFPNLPIAPPAERPVCWCVIEEVGRGQDAMTALFALQAGEIRGEG